MLRMLSKRHLEFTGLRTHAVYRLHSVLMSCRPVGWAVTCHVGHLECVGGETDEHIVGKLVVFRAVRE